jgi:hypothetical protein
VREITCSNDSGYQGQDEQKQHLRRSVHSISPKNSLKNRGQYIEEIDSLSMN